ncbi:hypothetical protein LSCM1_07463 [Leishmania martiniquensis]|uniref:Uncharacterized protein n=1 Tax=Leishmania martiniquensis TaxID=1580590 RepID=A0A836L3P3_9TRYP|nr:hypothetical protein LSCM1_07463 [Leishmania martiniquensis]
MSSHVARTAAVVVLRSVVDEQQPLRSSTAIRSGRANINSGDPVDGHAHRGARYPTSLSASRSESAADTKAAHRVAKGTKSAGFVGAATAATEEASSRRSAASSPRDLGGGVEEFLRKATNDADVPPGLLRFLQSQQSHRSQQQRQQAQRQSENGPRNYSPFTNSVLKAANTTSPPPSPAMRSRGLRSDAPFKAAVATTARQTLTAVKGYGSDGIQLYRSADAANRGHAIGSAVEGAETHPPHSAIGEGEDEGGGGNTHAQPSVTAATVTAKQLEANMYQQRHQSIHAMTASSANANGALEQQQPCASALQRRSNAITDVCEGILSVDSCDDAAGVAAMACCDASPSSVDQQCGHGALAEATHVCHNTPPAFLSPFGSRPGSQADGLPRVLPVCDGSPLRKTSDHPSPPPADCVQEAAGGRLPLQQPPETPSQPTSSASPILSPPSLVRSSLQSVANSASAHYTDWGAHEQPNVIGKEALKSRSSVAPTPLPQLWSAAPRASSRTSASTRLFGGAATAGSVLLSGADAPHAGSPSSAAAACGRLVPVVGSAAKGSCSSLGATAVPHHQPQPRLRRVHVGGVGNHSSSGAKSTGAEAVAAAVGIIDVVTAGSLSGRLSSYGEVEPSLTAGVAWIGPLSSCPPSVTTATAGTLTSANYCYSGASNSMTV